MQFKWVLPLNFKRGWDKVFTAAVKILFVSISVRLFMIPEKTKIIQNNDTSSYVSASLLFLVGALGLLGNAITFLFSCNYNPY